MIGAILGLIRDTRGNLGVGFLTMLEMLLVVEEEDRLKLFI